MAEEARLPHSRVQLGERWQVLGDLRSTDHRSQTGANRFVVGGESRYRGLELSASGEITPFWSVVACAQLLDAKIVSGGAANAARGR